MSERQLLIWQIGWLLRFYIYNRQWWESHDWADEEEDA